MFCHRKRRADGTHVWRRNLMRPGRPNAGCLAGIASSSWGVAFSLGLLAGAGCAGPPIANTDSVVVFLDGAGWSGSHRRVEAGLRAAGYRGHVESFAWSSLLGPGPEHLLVARKKRKARQLAERIAEYRQRKPGGELHLMGLSAGSAVVVFALEQLPANVAVDNVVLFSPSISAKHDLSVAMEHVNGHLYATSSPYDKILAGVFANADGVAGRPAGLHGLRVPSRVKRYDLYARVVNLPWRPAYADLGWNGSHTGVTRREFVQHVIAPRILSNGPRPLDRPMAPDWISARNRTASTAN